MCGENEIQVWKLIPKRSELEITKFNPGHPINTLDDASKFLPGGAYTTLRTYSRTRVMSIGNHFLRLEESAQRANAKFQPPFEGLRPALKKILNLSPFPESRLRLTLDLENEPGCFYVALERLHTPPDVAYREGAKAISRRMQRVNPRAKLTGFIPTASKYKSQLPKNVNEMLMVDDNGALLEGLSSNFFGVIGGIIWTAEEGVLLGITRGAILEIAALNNIPFRFGGIQLNRLKTMDECFITSASRGVLPVVQIDETIIGNGKPGKITQDIIQLFSQWVEKTAEEI